MSRTKNRYRFSYYEKVSSESNASWNAKLGHSAVKVWAREKGQRVAATDWCRCLMPAQTYVCVCECVCAPESVWSCDTASMASMLHLRLQLQLLDPLYVIRSWWRMLARRSECAKEKGWPSSRDAEGSSDTGSHRSYLPAQKGLHDHRMCVCLTKTSMRDVTRLWHEPRSVSPSYFSVHIGACVNVGQH